MFSYIYIYIYMHITIKSYKLKKGILIYYFYQVSWDENVGTPPFRHDRGWARPEETGRYSGFGADPVMLDRLIGSDSFTRILGYFSKTQALWYACLE